MPAILVIPPKSARSVQEAEGLRRPEEEEEEVVTCQPERSHVEIEDVTDSDSISDADTALTADDFLSGFCVDLERGLL